MNNLMGKAFVLGANIDTDQIYPGCFLECTNAEEIARHCMEGVVPDFHNRFNPGDIIVAASNFGCGSSREHAAISLKYSGVRAILAESFGRIFYRNAINLGIAALICPGVSEFVKMGDTLQIDFASGQVFNQATGMGLLYQPVGTYALDILENGGIKPLIQRLYAK